MGLDTTHPAPTHPSEWRTVHDVIGALHKPRPHRTMSKNAPPIQDTPDVPPPPDQQKPPSDTDTSEEETSRKTSILDRIIDVIKQAGTPGEENTTRSGAFSHKAETHAAAMGLAAGWFATTQGETQLLSIVYAAAVYGRNLEASGQRRRVIQDVIKEPHYALFFAATGALLGTLTNGAVHGIELIGDVPMV